MRSRQQTQLMKVNGLLKNIFQKQLKDLGMTLKDHAHKQVQLHSAASNIAQRYTKTAPPEFGETFQYGKFILDFE